jgi:nucleoside-diphosphate-sugar epimerase
LVRILIIGGTGFLGRRIAETFVRRGDQVAVLSRGHRPLRDFPSSVELVAADRHDPTALNAVLYGRDFDIVVDNIAFSGSDVGQTLDLLNGRVGHYLLTSSAAVYADRYTRRPIREQDADLTLRLPSDAPDPFHPRLGQAYGNGKREAEQVLAAQTNAPWTILRPPVVLGADDRTLRVWWFVQRLLDGGPILIPDWGPGRVFQVVWTEDIARAFVTAAGNEHAFGQTYNVGQAEIYTAESWIEAAATTLQVALAYAHVPEEALRGLGLPDYTLPIAGRPFGHLLLDLSHIQHDLAFEPSPESVWLTETLQGCAANPPTENSPHYARRAEELRATQTP